MSIPNIYSDSEYWREWGQKMDAIWAGYDAARLKTYMDFYERQTGIRPQPGDEIEMLGTGITAVPSGQEDGS